MDALRERSAHGRRTLILVACVLLSACAAAPPIGGLQERFDELHRERANCRTAAATTEPARCDDPAAYVAVARDAQDAAADAPDARTAIATLRLAAVAGWESRAPAGLEIAEAAAAHGIARCDALPEDQFGAPRDCALLRVAPGMVVHVRTFQLLDAIGDRTALTDGERIALAGAGTGYVANAWDTVERARHDHIDGDPDVDPSVIDWLDRQRLTFYCTLVKLASVNRTHAVTPAGSAVLRQADPYVNAHPALANADCSRAEILQP